jgi:aryl-alcohol dehydrogenase-like predicted oxidoreductase
MAPWSRQSLIGEAIRGRRDKAFLSVKSGQLWAPGPNGTFAPGPVNGHPDYLRNAVLQSLQRLKVDYIDFYTPARLDTIPGSKRISHLEENIGSEAVQLNADDLQRIEVVMPLGTVSEPVPGKVYGCFGPMSITGGSRF